MHFAQLLVATIPLMAGMVSGDAIVFSEPNYDGATLLIPGWAKCHNLDGALKNHIGSLMVPKDWMCSLHKKPGCKLSGEFWTTDEYAPDLLSTNVHATESVECGPKNP